MFEPCLVQIHHNLLQPSTSQKRNIIQHFTRCLYFIHPTQSILYTLHVQATQNRNVTTKDPPLGASLGPSLAFALKPKIRVLDRFKAKDLKIGSFGKIGFVGCFSCGTILLLSRVTRAFNTDFGMGEDQSPPIGGGQGSDGRGLARDSRQDQRDQKNEGKPMIMS